VVLSIYISDHFQPLNASHFVQVCSGDSRMAAAIGWILQDSIVHLLDTFLSECRNRNIFDNFNALGHHEESLWNEVQIDGYLNFPECRYDN
jgi:hypothetical protein